MTNFGHYFTHVQTSHLIVDHLHSPVDFRENVIPLMVQLPLHRQHNSRRGTAPKLAVKQANR